MVKWDCPGTVFVVESQPLRIIRQHNQDQLINMRTKILAVFVTAAVAVGPRTYSETAQQAALANTIATARLNSINQSDAASWERYQDALLAAKDQAAAAVAKKKWDDAVAEIDLAAATRSTAIEQQYRPEMDDLQGRVTVLSGTLARLLFAPKDPWRKLAGERVSAKDPDWVKFTGTVLGVRPDGILMDGEFGPPLAAAYGRRKYFVQNFPVQKYPFADGEKITDTMDFVAHLGGNSIYTYTNTTIDLSVETVRRLDYGEVLAMVPTEGRVLAQIAEDQSELAAVKSRLDQLTKEYDAKKNALENDRAAKIADLPNVFARQLKEARELQRKQGQAKAVQFDQAQADRGEALGLQRMAERYRDGDGVEKDPVKADQYFQKAKAAADAQAEQIAAQDKLREQAAMVKKIARNRALAETGSVDSMIFLGKCYRDGDGVDKDLNQAREYFQKATDLGSDKAAKLLDTCQ